MPGTTRWYGAIGLDRGSMCAGWLSRGEHCNADSRQSSRVVGVIEGDAFFMRNRFLAAVVVAVVGVAASCVAQTAERVIAIVPFAGIDSSAATQAEGARLAEYVAAFMGQSRMIKIVERVQFVKVLSEIALAQSDLVDDTTAARAAKMVGADRLVIGTFQRQGAMLKLNARIVAVHSGTIEGSAIAEGSKERDALNNLSIKLLKFLDVETRSNAGFRARRALAFTSTGLAAALAGTALWSQLRYRTAADRYNSSDNLTAAQYDALAAKASFHMNARYYFGGSAAALLATGVVLFVVNKSEWDFTRSTKPVATALALVGPDAIGFRVRISF